MESAPRSSDNQPATASPRPWPVYWMLAANLISNLGNNITMLAVPWFVLQTTGSAGKMGLVAAATVAPLVISSFIGGALTDRMSHRQLAVGSDILSGITVAAIPALYFTIGLNLSALMALVFLGAIFDGPGMNARMAMIPKLARDSNIPLPRVNSGFDIGRSLVSLVGAPIGGILIALVGSASVLWIDAATFAISAIIVRLMVPATSRPEPSGTSITTDMMAGMRFLWQSRLLRSIGLSAMALNMVFNPLFTIGIPVYIQNSGHDAGTLGFLMTSVAAGVLAGSALYGWAGDRFPARATVIASLTLLTVPLFGVALEPDLPVMWVLLFVINFGSGIVNPLLFTFFHRHTPEDMLGRALGTFMSAIMLASPVGLLLGGAIIVSQGFSFAVLAGAMVTLLFAVLLALNSSLGDLDRPEPAPATT